MTDDIEKLKMHSPDMTAQNVDRIAALFPGCVTEAKGPDGTLRRMIDFDLLRQELSDSIVDGPQERYHLDWPGKRQALITANAPIAKTLRPVRAESVDFDTTRNLIIEGDNLEALKLLQETYLGKVKMIYIDPPYNTGNDFIYEDDFAESAAEFLERSNQADEAGNKLVANTESNGRFHSDWLSMIYARLRLSKNILCDKGIIAVSIGPEEVKNLISALSEVFGEENKVSIITWEKGRKNDSTFFSDSAEYMVIFAKDKEELAQYGKWRKKKDGLDQVLSYYEGLCKEYPNDHDLIGKKMKSFYAENASNEEISGISHFARSDNRGLFFGDNISSASTSIPDYEILHPVTKKPVKKPARGWGATEPVMLERIREGRVLFGADERTIPLKKSYLKEVDSIVKTPVIYKDGRAASGILKGLFGEVVFNNPKDHEVLKEILSYCTQDDPEAIFVDFFAGSGSTAHAVLELNASDGKKRQHIMVQIPEPLDETTATSPAAKQTITRAKMLLSQLNRPHTIAEITKERIRRAGAKILEGDCHPDWNRDVGFRVLKIDSSNMADVYYTPDATTQADLLTRVDNIKQGRTAEDLLFQVLLDWGVDLTLPITRETVEGKTVFTVAGTALIACFDNGVDEALVKALATRKPLRVVFKDTGFKDDATKINVKQIFKSLSPDTDVKAI